MATLYITEFSSLDPSGSAAVAPPVTGQTVAIAGASAQSAAFATNTRIIRVHTDVICSILIGSNPTATAAQARMAAGQTEYFVVKPGDKIAVITNT